MKREALAEKRQETDSRQGNAERFPAMPPQRIRYVSTGRSPGLRVRKILALPPSRAKTQWHSSNAALAYRCGGSSGIASWGTRTAFPFHCPRRNRWAAPENGRSIAIKPFAGEKGARRAIIRRTGRDNRRPLPCGQRRAEGRQPSTLKTGHRNRDSLPMTPRVKYPYPEKPATQ
jgi:hypothetical protein